MDGSGGLYYGYGRRCGVPVRPERRGRRGSRRTLQEALDHAFARTLTPREDFQPTKWATDATGDQHPVEWRAPNGAEVNVDRPHTTHGPDAPHVGWQTGGQRKSGGARGHIILDAVPYSR